MKRIIDLGILKTYNAHINLKSMEEIEELVIRSIRFPDQREAILNGLKGLDPIKRNQILADQVTRQRVAKKPLRDRKITNIMAVTFDTLTNVVLATGITKMIILNRFDSQSVIALIYASFVTLSMNIAVLVGVNRDADNIRREQIELLSANESVSILNDSLKEQRL